MSRVVFILFGISLCCLCACNSQKENDKGANQYLNMDPGVAFVGKEACKTCHADRYETYVASEMGRSFRLATLSNSSAQFDNIKPVYDAALDLYYQPFNRGEELFIMEYRLAGKDTVHKRIEKIDYIVGSGHHTNSHMREENGYIYQIPLTWYVQDGHWDLPPGFHDGKNARFNRPIQLECMNCHNARPSFVMGSENRFTSVPHGIDCESCHGAGDLHVKTILSGKVVDITKEIDYTIVNPRKLPLERQFDVCQRCHMQGASVLAEGKSYLDFRPGHTLEDYVNVVWPRHADSLRQFIMASHPDRLKMSPCFRATWKEGSGVKPMTCITCHNPHVSVRKLGTDYYNKVCQSCHTPARRNECTEDTSVRAQNGDNCFACHMPASGTSDIPHVRITDHNIRKPDRLSPQQAERQVRFFGLASLIKKNPTPRDLADGYLTYFEQFESRPQYLDSAAVYLKLAEKSASQQTLLHSLVRLWFLQGNSRAIIELAGRTEPNGITDAWTNYRIGEAYSRLGNVPGAIPFFEAAVRLAPEHLRFMNRLANAYVADRKYEQAVQLLNTILQYDPTYDTAYNDRGFLHVLAQDFPGAEQDLKRALSLDPDARQALANLASLYFNLGRKTEARLYTRRLIELDPRNPDYQKLWSMLK